MVKVGLIGAGFMAKTHAAAYKELADQLDVKITAVADIREEEAKTVAEAHSATYTTNYDDIINDPDIDVVDICLPTFLHADAAAKAMKARKSVFLEKPAVLKPEEGEMLLAVQKETGAAVMVGHCIRLWPAYMYLKEAYDNSTYGKLKDLVMKRLSFLPTYGWDNWFDDESRSGNAILDLHIHDADFMRYMLGEPDKMHIGGRKEHVFGIYEYNNGPSVQIEGGWDYPQKFPFAMEYRAIFENATVVYADGKLMVYTNDDATEIDQKIEVSSVGDLGGNLSDLGGYYNELRYFYDCLINNKPMTIAPLSEGIASVNFIYKEIETGGF